MKYRLIAFLIIASLWAGACTPSKQNCGVGIECFANDVAHPAACEPGYRWQHDECVDINECAQERCLNGGSCNNTEGSYICECPAEWTGLDCSDPEEFQEDIDTASGPDQPVLPLTVELPMDRAVVQRDDQNLGFITIKGRYGPSYTQIQVRATDALGAERLHTIETIPAEHSFEGEILSQTGWHKVEVCGIDENASETCVLAGNVGVGEVFIVAGQSNAACFAEVPMTAESNSVSAGNYFGPSWEHAVDPLPMSDVFIGGEGGSSWPILGDLIASNLDVPVGFVVVAEGGTSVQEWQQDFHVRLEEALEFLKTQSSSESYVRGVLWHQGENNSYPLRVKQLLKGERTVQHALSLAENAHQSYVQSLMELIHQSQSYASQDREDFVLPWFVARASFILSALIKETDDLDPLLDADGGVLQDWQDVQTIFVDTIEEAQQVVIDNETLDAVYEGPNTNELLDENRDYDGESPHFSELGQNNHAAGWYDHLLGFINY